MKTMNERKTLNKEEQDQMTAAAAIMLAEFNSACNLKGTDYWDMTQWKKTGHDDAGDEWNNAFNANMDPWQWDEDWRQHIDFTTDEGTKRLAAWLAAASKTVNNGPTFHHSITPGKTIINETGVWYNVYWFVGKTAVSYAAEDDPAIETLYCAKVLSEWDGHIESDGLCYVNAMQARNVLNKIKEDIHDGNYLAWLKEHADLYNVINEPEPRNAEDW